MASARIQRLLFWISPSFMSVFLCVFVGNWRRLETRWQQIDPTDHRWKCASRDWVVQALERHVLSLPPWSVVFQTIHLYPCVLRSVYLSLDTLTIKVPNVVRVIQNINILIRKCFVLSDKGREEKKKKKTVSKRGSGTFFSGTSSHFCLSSLSVLWHVIFF